VEIYLPVRKRWFPDGHIEDVGPPEPLQIAVKHPVCSDRDAFSDDSLNGETDDTMKIREQSVESSTLGASSEPQPSPLLEKAPNEGASPLEQAILEAVRSHFQGEGEDNFSEDSLSGALCKALNAHSDLGSDSKKYLDGGVEYSHHRSPSDPQLDEIMIIPDPDTIFADTRLTEQEKIAMVQEYLKHVNSR
jgi:hypothetical protein